MQYKVPYCRLCIASGDTVNVAQQTNFPASDNDCLQLMCFMACIACSGPQMPHGMSKIFHACLLKGFEGSGFFCNVEHEP